MWILDHPRDLTADFRAFYHLSLAEALALGGPEFLALAYRLPLFPGVMAVRAQQQDAEVTRNVRNQGARLVTSERADILADPLLRDLIEMN